VELTDLLESKGLAVPALSSVLQATIASHLPPHGSAVNPIDVTTDWQRFAAMYGFTVEVLMTSGEVDAVVPILLHRSALMPEVCDAVIAASERMRQQGSQKPIHVCWVAPRSADANRKKLQAAGVPCHAWPGATAAAVVATVSRPIRPLARLSAGEPILQPAAVDDAGWLTSAAALSLLQQAGFPVARWIVVTDPAAAAAAAAKLQFPVVLKAERPKLTHKSDAGAVRLGLTDGAAVAEAFEDFSRRLGAGPALLQRQAGPGAELILGARRDPLFGPIVMAGLGGVWTEILDDVALRLAPIEAEEAQTMLDELKGRKLFAGYRGRPPIDLFRFSRLVADLSQWFCAAPWLGELDLNPIIADSDEFTIVDVRMRVADSVAIA
jgi:acyl-CoA synthetase (NDP forming)